MDEILKENKYTVGIIIIIVVFLLMFFVNENKNLKASEELKISSIKQDLILKCLDIYENKHAKVEESRYFGSEKNSIIWSDKTKSCLAYYYDPQGRNPGLENFSHFEVWDYSNDDTVLSYKSERDSSACAIVSNNQRDSYTVFSYKYDESLNGNGCDLTELHPKKNDLLSNFSKSMIELGFKE